MEIIEKPWGKEEIIEINEKYMVKKLTMWKEHRCSLQFHNHKKETIYVLSGKLRIVSGPIKITLKKKFIWQVIQLPSLQVQFIVWKVLKIAFILRLARLK